MRISSPGQYELSSDAVPPQQTKVAAASSVAEASGVIEFPDFGRANFAEAARLAGRMNAASASTTELSSLLSERQTLLDKKFDGKITPSEENRLAFVRWSIDRIQSARSEFALEELEHLVDRYEELLTGLDS